MPPVADMSAQVAWTGHLWNLLSRSADFLLSALGTTLLAVVIFSVVVPIVVLLIAAIRSRRDNPGQSVLRAVFVSIRPAIISVAVPLAAWIVLFAWSVAATIYREHNDFVQVNAALRDGMKRLTNEAERKDAWIADLNAKLEKLNRATTTVRATDSETAELQRQLNEARAKLDVRARNQVASEDFGKLVPQWRALIARCSNGEDVEKEANTLYETSADSVRRHLGNPSAERFISAPYPFATFRADYCKAYRALVAKETALNKFIEELAARSP